MDQLAQLTAQAAERQSECSRLRQVIVDRLDLPVDPDWITDDQPLFGRGLELDSVDALEIMVGIEDEFGASITDDETDVFGSVNALLDRINEEVGA
ncbi:MAG TPA: phosphopantetheine-binding protein [Microthrixaceae bacterium]|nr:phosphopantetheine-binding protein [Microthrixaceae bacterium]